MTTMDERADTIARPADPPTTHGPLWVLRVNPLRRSRLSDPALRDLLGRLTEAETVVRSAAERCSTELYPLIGSAPDEDARKRLVELRRAINHDRAPKDGPAPASVADWLAARERRTALRDEITREYPAAAERERVALAGILGDEDLRRALALVAPEVFGESERYRAAVAAGPVPARVRKSERGLLQYVTRAMVRTSPLSRFTAVGIAVPGPDGIAPSEVEFAQPTTLPGLDRVMLAYVLAGLHPGLANAWVGLAPTSAIDAEDGKLYFLRPTDTGFQRLAVPVQGPIRLLLDAIAMGPRQIGGVATHLVTTAGWAPEMAIKLVATAVDKGMLVTFPEAEDGGADLYTVLDRPGPAAATLADVRARLTLLGDVSATERVTELAALGDDLATVSRLAQRPGKISIEEDYVLPPLTVAPAPWRGQLADLGATVELLSVFDWLHDIRVLMTAAFVQRFGAGANVPLAEHAKALSDEVSRRANVVGELPVDSDDVTALAGLGTPDGSLERLYALRRRLIDVTRADVDKALRANESEVTWSAADALALTDGMPDRLRRDPLSYGVLVQLAGDRLVFNDGLPGHGMLYSRFLDADRRLGGTALPHLAQRLVDRFGWDGSRVVEDLGLHRLNVNAHPRVLPDGLRPEDWFSLRLVHDRECDLLRIEDADGRRLRVVPLGTGHPGLFPPPLSVASSLVTAGRLNNYLLDSWHNTTPWDARQTRFAPRISVGDVLVARRRWYGGAELDSALGTGSEEHARLLALTAWRARHGVPAEVVVKTAFADTAPRVPEVSETLPRRQKHKPQYVDLTCALGTRVLPRMLERRVEEHAVGYVEEALPGVVDGTHVREWVVEIGRRPGGLFQYEGELG